MTSVINAAPTSAAAVANAFLDIQERDNTQFPPIDQMKLQKLVYYAHAWWLAYNDQALFDDDVRAWPWGPVVGSLYGDFKKFGRDPIRGHRALELVHDGDGPFDYHYEEPPAPSKEIMSFLESLWHTHKHLTGVQLSNATHAENEPWTIVRDRHGSLDDKPTIPNSVIRDVFKSKLGRRSEERAGDRG